MIALLEQAVALGVLRPLDVQFARVVANEDEPDILLAAACLSAEAGAGHVCLLLEQLQVDTLFEGRQPALALAVWEAAGRPDGVRWQQ
ncbi:exodeoxyribonuclease V subunit alpha, partial [Serratia marcescens subsp. marcescens ATCC 13880]